MLIFNCTKATEDFFTVNQDGEKKSLVEVPFCEDMAEDIQHLKHDDGSEVLPFQWVLHTVSIKNNNYLVAMEVDSRFAAVVNMERHNDIMHYLQYFIAVLSSQMLVYGQERGVWTESDVANIVGNCVAHTADVHLFRRSDRSVQAQINEVVRTLKSWAQDKPGQLKGDSGMLRFCQAVNGELRKSLAFPEQESILPVEKMLGFWQQHYQFEASSEIFAEMPEFPQTTAPAPDANTPTSAGASREPAVSSKVGRNEVCPCGSGKKYKKCCMYQVA